eukprot:CAMPEP_0197516138 /NCGR_PEP_ID=MMETSP1318-20131121/1008_1 /TAXON_ID=552666 /ORGANISM="Partenskyella glossopodia, Strain RCC365" /LENGTH=165 /DNA_ID=CAMNT_0043064657 /DNA_START=172 /DNA_END=669 /DNA_ORIENTATION=+
MMRRLLFIGIVAGLLELPPLSEAAWSSKNDTRGILYRGDEGRSLDLGDFTNISSSKSELLNQNQHEGGYMRMKDFVADSVRGNLIFDALNTPAVRGGSIAFTIIGSIACVMGFLIIVILSYYMCCLYKRENDPIEYSETNLNESHVEDKPPLGFDVDGDNDFITS